MYHMVNSILCYIWFVVLQGAWLLTEVYDIKLRVIYLTREWKFEWKVVEYNVLLCTNSIVFFFFYLLL